MVTLPSFGTDGDPADPPLGTRTQLKPRQTFEVTVVGTANSGGAFEPYKNLLRGEKYTTYIDTSLGTVVMEFAAQTASSGFGAKLSSPQSVRTTLPAGLPRTRMVVACTLDASGNVRNVRVLEAGSADMTAKVVAALNGWKFQPALRGDQPVEVTAILGFGINTNDRF
jgi:TonB family protein